LKSNGLTPAATFFYFSGMSQLCFSAIFLADPIPNLGTQSFVIGSKTILDLLALVSIPFSYLNFSHLVNGLGFGIGFSLGKTTLGSGNSTVNLDLVYSRIVSSPPASFFCYLFRSNKTL